jgi:eukaryotic-like serine/threonine-protein kinase
MPDRVGQQLGNYQLLRLLGEGGFAEVYLGEHIHLGTQAAVKVLHTQLARSDIEQFRQEARTIAHLRHQHIIRVLDFGVEGTTPFLVMDYAQGGTLRTLHPKGTRLPTDLVVSYVKQVASALHYAHEHKIVHRDIKPENMLIGEPNEILLSDFGIALIAQSSRYQNTTDMMGTIAYMAPEQIAGHPRTASDQYALGIVVYEWLCGTVG